MALIRCPECGKEISDKAASCPNCGCPMRQERNVYLQEEYGEDEEESNSELWKDDIVYGVLSIMICIFSTIMAFRINDGIGLIFPFILYIISAFISSRQRKIVSLIGLIMSALGIALIVAVVIFF